jgi:hypothetical protein
MTSLITQVTSAIIAASSYGWISTTFGAIAVLLLVFLLIQKEVLRAIGEARALAWMRAFNIAIVPLLIGFGLIISVRLVILLSRDLQ